MIIALASPRIASSIEEGLDKIKRSLSEAAAQGAEVMCLPEGRTGRYAKRGVRVSLTLSFRSEVDDSRTRRELHSSTG